MPGLRTARRMSHVFILDVPAYPRLLFVTDAAVNIAPGIDDQGRHRAQCDRLARILGVEMPTACDAVRGRRRSTPKMQSTLDAAALCKMADRGQITGGLVDGPLAFDNAVSERCGFGQEESHRSVAGRADILLAPDLDSGNMIAK